jgi:hypothetical protein
MMLDEDALSFNHAVWNANTEITLTNVPWNNDYRDIVPFATQAALNTWIDASDKYPATIVGSYARVAMPIKLDIPFEIAQGYNYLRARNGAQPIAGSVASTFYYFILDVQMLAPNTTQLTIQIDVWQSFGRKVQFGQSYVERGHIGVANANNFANNGRDYLTIPEGLDIGSEYQTIAYKNTEIMGVGQTLTEQQNYRVMIVTTIDLLSDYGDSEHPRQSTATGDYVQGLPSGANIYMLFPEAFDNLMVFLKDRPWIAQGIISICAIPRPSDFGYGQTLVTIPGTGIQLQKITGSGSSVMKFYGIENWRDDANINAYIPARYSHLRKFFTSPYCMIEVTMFNGRPLILKPESWNSASSEINMRPVFMPPHLKMVATPKSYNAVAGAVEESWENNTLSFTRTVPGDDGGDYLDVSTILDNFPQFTIVNNMGLMYLAQNANQIAFGYGAADWAQQRAMGSNQMSYDQATVGMQTAANLGLIARNADIDSTAQGNQTGFMGALLGAGGQLIGGAAGGAAIGGGAGAAAGAAAGLGSAAMGLLGNQVAQQGTNAQLAIRNAANVGSMNAQQGNSAYMRDTNKSLADWAAHGDYETNIAGMNAKIQDARLTAPSVVGQMGGEAFNMIHNAMVLSVRYKFIDHAAMSVVGEYWLRYGYAVRRFIQMPENLHMMTKFTYWKLSETYINAAPMPESFKQIIRGIFEKGVTVWVSPDDIGNIDLADNMPLDGITL